MVTQPQAEAVEKERDDGWRVMPTRKTVFTKPSAMTIMVTVVDDKLVSQVVLADGSRRPTQPGELQKWWDGL